MSQTKKKIYIILLIFSLVFGVLIRFGILPFLTSIKSASRGIYLERNALQLFKSRLGELENFKDNYSLYQPTLEKLKNSFANYKAPVNFIEFLEREAKDLGLLIKISPKNVTLSSKNPWVPVPFSISLGGSFPDCLKFLTILQQSHFLVEISQLNIQRVSEKSNLTKEFAGLKPGDVIFNFPLKAYSREQVLKK